MSVTHLEESPDADQSAMRRLAGDDDTALDDLMERHGERLFHYLIRCLQNETEAADLAEETFVRVYLHRARFDPRLKFSTWLYTIATNLVRDRERARRRHPHVSLDAVSADTGRDFRETLPHAGPSPREAVEAGERAAAVRRAVAALPDELRVPLVLAEYEDKSHADIAAILRCSPKAVEMRIYRARQQLRAELGPLLAAA
ncbi:MAG: sigma-70 family RNA polymerase sigma factor [Verrucomicrobia bacterium]|nr:sigma-70 family RNA polymerase sigma factor [Verrucomicrobiota bacterium]